MRQSCSRVSTVATAGQTVVSYSYADDDELLVYVDGVLKREGSSNDYTTDADDDEVTFTSGLSAGEVVTIYKIRTSSITGYTRSGHSYNCVSNRFLLLFVHDEDTVLQVYKNGILQREGGLTLRNERLSGHGYVYVCYPVRQYSDCYHCRKHLD